MVELIFKAYRKKLLKYFVIIFFLHIKMLKEIIEKIKKDFQKSLVIGSKIFLKKRKTKGQNCPKKDIKLLLKKKNKKGVIRIFLRGKKETCEYRRKYYLAHTRTNY